MIQVLEPATERVLAELDTHTADDVDAAVERAKRALPGWAGMSPSHRAALLRRIAVSIDANRDELIDLEIRNAGKTYADAEGEVDDSIDLFNYFSGAPERLMGLTVPVSGGVAFTTHEPIGVVGVITAWNSPLVLLARKIAPALAAGNVVVQKPAELTPLSALRLEEILLEAGLPEHVFEVVVGAGSVIGERLVTHADVGKISFTGSIGVGQSIAARCGQLIKHVSLELGGKSANIVFEDVDVADVARKAGPAVFGSAGQDCCARTRILVQDSIINDFLAAFEPVVRSIKVGNPTDRSVEVGPLISAKQRDSVAAYVERANAVAIVGTAPQGPGFWYPPTVIAPDRWDSETAQNEIFGPVVSIIPFHSEDDAITIANSTKYGLAASIWTPNGARGLRVAQGLHTGNISINSHLSVRVQTPFGGVKQSGLGRELGPNAVHDFTETKTIFTSTTT
ncbi:MAG: aldehyde dehydrogenase [Mycobacterium sp.]|nr:aldehyde dehydrogenase [Mycobacterium sp.]